ncbi:hypothetical protein CPC16_007123 [Podila verticillata]|nr:hypothetical protein BGZ52_012690 [Haplosporangium bisporale]KAF9387312.1 hypothetical protein CPC16_007123 [Podila verticillata]KAI9241511.1 MAG: histidine phosphatase superfamily [Podila humilis]
MKFILFRHGHSLANQESRIVSSLEHGTKKNGGPLGTGFGLSDKGKQEVHLSATSLADHIKSYSTSTKKQTQVSILASPFKRTLETANLIHDTLQTSLDMHIPSPVQVLDLRERFFGEFEMQTPSDDLYTAVWNQDAIDPFHQKFGVESVATVTQRTTGVVRSEEQKVEEGAETFVILVSHGDALQILQTAMRGWSGDRHRQLEHLNTASWREVKWCPELAEVHRR